MILDKDYSTKEEIDNAEEQLKQAISDLKNTGGIDVARDLSIDGMVATAGSQETAEIWAKTADAEEYLKVMDHAAFGRGWNFVTFDVLEKVTKLGT